MKEICSKYNNRCPHLTDYQICRVSQQIWKSTDIILGFDILGLMSLPCSFLWLSPKLPRPFGDCGHFYYEDYSSLRPQTAVCSSACVAPWLPLTSTKLEYGHKMYWTLTLKPCPVEQASVPLRWDSNPPSQHPEASLTKFCTSVLIWSVSWNWRFIFWIPGGYHPPSIFWCPLCLGKTSKRICSLYIAHLLFVWSSDLTG